MIIAVQNLSTLVSDEDAYNMTMIVDHQVRTQVASAWGVQPPFVVYLNDGAKQKYEALIGILDDADQAGDLGWHTEGPDADVYGRVFARPVLDNGGTVLDGKLSVCSVLSHEVIEVMGDHACNGWAQRTDGVLIANELCDPVEGDSYPMTIRATDGASVTGTVSDFVFGAWFDPNASAPFDWLNLLSAPFEVREDGYVITMSGGAVSVLWGERYPGWKIAAKEHPTARTARRDASVVPQEPLENNIPTTLA